MPFHLVCHDCTLEEVKDSYEAAEALVDEHRDQTRHSVEFMEVSL